MNKIFLLVIGVLLLSACATDGNPKRKSFESARCESTAVGYTRTRVTYGDDGIKMKGRSRVRPNSEFRIKLKPRPKDDWEGKLVSVKGNTLKSDADADWIDGSGRAKDLKDGWFVAGCVPNDVEEGIVYKFDIEVKDLVRWDPRVEVTN